MNKEAFVYIWINETTNRKYIGYHKGDINDGYISSSRNDSFWEDFENSNMCWRREILFYGTTADCLSYEQKLLKKIDISSDEYYNNARGANVIWTDEVKNKHHRSIMNFWNNVSDEFKENHANKISETKIKKGFKHTDKTKELISNSVKQTYKETPEEILKERIKRQADGKRGKKYHSEKFKNDLSERMKGNNYGSMISEESKKKKSEFMKSDNNPGKNPSEETKRKISETKKHKYKSGELKVWNKGKKRKQIECPHCGKIGGDGLMQRWHFDNCKFKNK